MDETQLIAACKRNDRKAQKILFDRYSPVMFGVCKRYIHNREDAEDVLVSAFFKVLTQIDSFKGDGSFEGWIRRIVINESLMFLRKSNHFQYLTEINDVVIPTTARAVDQLAAEDILGLLDQLPTGYRTIFNLYAVEGYKHREIAELLGISINTSKSQLILARKRMQELLEGVNYPDLEGRELKPD